MITEFGEASTFTRGEIVAVDDSGRGQLLTVKGFRGERFSGVLRDQPHGFSSVPPVGATGWFERVGSSDRLRAVGYDGAWRPVGSQTGTAVLYDDKGNTIFAKGVGGIAIRAMAGGFEVEADVGTITLKRGGLSVTVSESRIDLGGPGGAPVSTAAGLSGKVFAIL